MLKVLPYLLPLLPFLTRLFLLKYRKRLPRAVSRGERNVESNRALLVGFLSLTFAGLLAVTIADAKLKLTQPLPVYFILISFLFYYSAYNLQAYTYRRWVYHLSETMITAAAMSLMLCIASTAWLYGSNINKRLIASVVSLVWFSDEIISLCLLDIALSNLAGLAPVTPKLPQKASDDS